MSREINIQIAYKKEKFLRNFFFRRNLPHGIQAYRFYFLVLTPTALHAGWRVSFTVEF
jgi:hypothetical protein